MKRIASLLLALCLLLSLGVAFALTPGDRRVVVGADLTEEQLAAVYESFGVVRGEVPELTITNAEEKQLLREGSFLACGFLFFPAARAFGMPLHLHGRHDHIDHEYRKIDQAHPALETAGCPRNHGIGKRGGKEKGRRQRKGPGDERAHAGYQS